MKKRGNFGELYCIENTHQILSLTLMHGTSHILSEFHTGFLSYIIAKSENSIVTGRDGNVAKIFVLLYNGCLSYFKLNVLQQTDA